MLHRAFKIIKAIYIGLGSVLKIICDALYGCNGSFTELKTKICENLAIAITAIGYIRHGCDWKHADTIKLSKQIAENGTEPDKLTIEDINPGAVLLCHKEDSFPSYIIGRPIKCFTKSDYTHAAIYLGESDIAEAVPICGVRKTRLSKLVKQYSHVSVFEHSDPSWSEHQLVLLNEFVDQMLNSRLRYNYSGAINWIKNKPKHMIEIETALHDYMSSQSSSQHSEQKWYMCSQFVCSCFHHCGFFKGEFIRRMYRPITFSPKCLIEDGYFGIFTGYLSSIEDYEMPVEDECYPLCDF